MSQPREGAQPETGAARGDAPGAIKQQLRDIARDIFTIEVSTIVKDGMTARKMPPVPIAVLEIVGKYYWYLVELGAACHLPEVEETLKTLSPAKRTNGPASFTSLAEITGRYLTYFQDHPPSREKAEADPASHPHPRDAVMVERIYRTSSVLEIMVGELARSNGALWGKRRAELMQAELFRAALEQQVDLHHLGYIRKVWEVGTETVALQSTLQLDGDVITRINAEFCEGKGELLQQMHIRATRAAVENWISVAEFLQRLISGVFNALLGLLRGAKG